MVQYLWVKRYRFPRKNKKMIDKDLFFSGLSLSKLFIYYFRPAKDKAECMPSECSEYIELRSADDFFSEHASR
jgi:hypothetical protein